MENLVNANPKWPILNVGSDQAININELAYKIGKHFKVDVEEANIISEKIDRYIPSTEKAYKDLRLICKYDLNRAIQQTLLLVEKRD